MRCHYCQEKAGFFKKTCGDCQKLFAIIHTAPESFGYREFLDHLLATGVAGTKIDKFLDADSGEGGSINDKITARMTNEIMAGLGQPSHMTGEDVKKVREDIAAGRPPSTSELEHKPH